MRPAGRGQHRGEFRSQAKPLFYEECVSVSVCLCLCVCVCVCVCV